MENMVKLQIDDKEVSVPKGTTIIEAAKRLGINIPHFCYHKMLKPAANCRICIVEVEKMPKLQTACSTLVSDGMIVHTSTPKVIEARRGVMEFILANHPLDCPVCDQGGECKLQDIAHEYTPMGGRFSEIKHTFPKEYIGPLIEREMNRCIQCLRCVRYCNEVMDVNAIAPINRGVETEIATFYHNVLECEFCGGCIRICPVGALTNRLSMYEFRPWQIKKTMTVCPYCGDGCKIILETKGDKLLRVSAEWDKDRNRGNLCAKGYFGLGFVNSPERLAQPMVRQYKKLVEVSWEEAIKTIAVRLNDIKDRYGQDAIAGIISSRCTDEDIYLFQRFFRGVIGTNNIDSTVRYGYINAIKGLRDAMGIIRTQASLEDIANTPMIFLIGADIRESNPITGLSVREAVKNNKAKLIIVHPFYTKMAKMASYYLSICPGSEEMLIKGLIKAIFENELYDKEIFNRFGSSLTMLMDKTREISYNEIEEKTGIKRERLSEVAALFAKAERGVLIFGKEIIERERGYKNVLSLIDLLIITGKFKDERWKITPLSTKTNDQGAIEMGGVPEYLPGGVEYSNKGYREEIERRWDTRLPSSTGATIMEIFEKILKGEIKALYLIGEDPLGDLPISAKIEDALGMLDLLICQELFMTETGERADIVLPVSSFAERDGRYTSTDGEILKVNKGIRAFGESKSDWEIISNISKGMGYPLEYASCDEIYKEINAIVAGYDDRGRIMDNIERYLSNGYIEKIEKRYLSVGTGDTGDDKKGDAVNGRYPFTLLLGDILYHSGRLSAYSKELMMISPQGGIMMNPMDADRLGISDKERILLRSPQGEIEISVNLNPRLPQGLLFFPESSFHTSIRRLFSLILDPDTNVPYFKRARVSAEKIYVT